MFWTGSFCPVARPIGKICRAPGRYDRPGPAAHGAHGEMAAVRQRVHWTEWVSRRPSGRGGGLGRQALHDQAIDVDQRLDVFAPTDHGAGVLADPDGQRND